MFRYLAISAPLLLAACAPTPLTVFSFAADGISYVATGKAVTDHALSAALGRDCAVFRIVRGDPPCNDLAPQFAAPVIYPGDGPARWTGTGLAELNGFAPGTEFYALSQDDGAVEIFAHDPDGSDGVVRLVATIDAVDPTGDRPTLAVDGTVVTVADLMV